MNTTLNRIAAPCPNLEQGAALFMKEADKMSSTEINSNVLVDISTVSVDRNLPKEARILEYVKQIKNPYKYKCGKFTIIERHTVGGPTFEDCLRRLMA